MKELLYMLAAVTITVVLVFLFGCAATQPGPVLVACQCPSESRWVAAETEDGVCVVKIPADALSDDKLDDNSMTDEEMRRLWDWSIAEQEARRKGL